MFELKKPVEEAAPQLKLHCTRGEPAPEGLVADAQALLTLPEEVKRQFDQVLLPYLGGEPDEDQQAWLHELCEKHGVEPAQLVGPIRGSRFLVTKAAQTAQSHESFSEDLAHLADDPRAIRELIEILVPLFERAAPVLRTEIMERTVAEHGRLVEACHWRVDKIVNSEHGDGINVPVAVLTFDYREGPQSQSITLQLLPEQLNELKMACTRMLPDGDGRS